MGRVRSKVCPLRFLAPLAGPEARLCAQAAGLVHSIAVPPPGPPFEMVGNAPRCRPLTQLRHGLSAQPPLQRGDKYQYLGVSDC